MSCEITSGIAKGCNDNIGGIKTMWLANGSAPLVEYQYDLPKQTAVLVETYNLNQQGGIVGFTQTLTIALNKLDASKQQEIKKIAEANDMRVKCLDNNNNTYEFGFEHGAYLASGSLMTGAGYGDRNGYELVLQADSREPMGMTVHCGTLMSGDGKHVWGTDFTQALRVTPNYFTLPCQAPLLGKESVYAGAPCTGLDRGYAQGRLRWTVEPNVNATGQQITLVTLNSNDDYIRTLDQVWYGDLVAGASWDITFESQVHDLNVGEKMAISTGEPGTTCIGGGGYPGGNQTYGMDFINPLFDPNTYIRFYRL